jgi:hypothetical protein
MFGCFVGTAVVSQPARLKTNRLIRSEEYDPTIWTKLGCSVGAPPTFPVLVEDGSTGSHAFQQAVGDDGYTPVRTLSAYLKAATRTWGLLSLTFGTGGASFGVAWFNLATGVVGTVTSNPAGATSAIQNIGNGVYRCSLTVATTLSITASVGASTGDTVSSYTGSNGTSAIQVTGVMLENASTPGTYYRS